MKAGFFLRVAVVAGIGAGSLFGHGVAAADCCPRYRLTEARPAVQEPASEFLVGSNSPVLSSGAVVSGRVTGVAADPN